MKVIYNNKEIMNNTNDYEQLLNLPMVNSAELRGVKTLSDVNAYSKAQVDELIGNSRAIEIVTVLPTNLIENTLYYVGPDANDFYDVYLVDEVRNVLKIGTSQFGEYFAGDGIDIDADNYISAKVDNKTITVDSENNLHAVLDIDTVPIMKGATLSVDGEKGLVPVPAIGSQVKSLRGDATWQSLIDLIYPVGSVYLTLGDTNPGNTMLGTTWSKITSGNALWTATTTNTYLLGALPNVTGSDYRSWVLNHQGTATTGTGILRKPAGTDYDATGNPSYSGTPYGTISIDAKWGTYKTNGTLMTEDETPYGKSNTVQPKAIKICMWRRTA